MDLKAFRTVLTQHLSGARMIKSTFSRERIITSLTQRKIPRLMPAIPGLSLTGTEFLTTSMPPYSTATAKLISSKTANITGMYPCCALLNISRFHILIRFDEDTGSVDSGGPGYPRNTGQWWFGCRADTPRKLRKETQEDRKFILD